MPTDNTILIKVLLQVEINVEEDMTIEIEILLNCPYLFLSLLFTKHVRILILR
jgi:hypothetical protein